MQAGPCPCDSLILSDLKPPSAPPAQVVPRNAVALTEQDKADASGVYEPPGDPVVERLAFSPAGDVMATVDSYPSTGGRNRFKLIHSADGS